MFQISGVIISANKAHTIDDVKTAAARRIGVKVSDFTGAFEVAKKSLDARKKTDMRWMYTVNVVLPKCSADAETTRQAPLQLSEYVTKHTPLHYTFPRPVRLPATRPVVIGSGPAGLFAALVLAEAGMRPIVLERGRPIDERVSDVKAFWQGAKLDCESNVQFGEGGAGTFSDGKLTTGIRDPRTRAVLDAFVEAGAPDEIMYLQKPHIGTDRLREVVTNLRKRIEGLGGEFRFGHKLVGLICNKSTLKAVEIEVNGEKHQLPTEVCILAAGHSARDTFDMLLRSGVAMEAKPFAVGVRIEHLQSAIDEAQYGRERGELLPPADYKLSLKTADNVGVYTFCMCPGGSVVAAASEDGGVVTNGMSLHARDGMNANSAVLVGVTPDMFGREPLDGVAFQRRLERAAFEAGGRGYRAPAQYVADFLGMKRRCDVRPTYLPGVTEAVMDAVLPPFVTTALREALPVFNRKLRGFCDGLLTGVESRSSSPVRILRDERLNSTVSGLIPCGEGAGYAGGIMSAAVDGMRCAEAVIAALCD